MCFLAPSAQMQPQEERANRCVLQKEQEETDRMGVCTEWEQGWSIVWSATWLPLGLDCFPRGLGSREGRRGEGGVSAEAELSRACWPLKRHVDRGWDVTRVSRVLGFMAEAPRKEMMRTQGKRRG